MHGRAKVQAAVAGVILRDKLPGQFSRAQLNPVFQTLTGAIGKMDVSELLSEWLKLIYGLAANPKTADFSTIAAKQLSLHLRERKLRASYALQIEALTNLAEHLIIDCQSPLPAKVVLEDVAWAIKCVESDHNRRTEQQWAKQECADKIAAATEACERLLPSRGGAKRASVRRAAEIADASGPRQECEKIPVYFSSFRNRINGTAHAYEMYGAKWVNEPNHGCAIVSVPHFRNHFTLPRDTAKEKSIRKAETIDRGRYFVVEKIIDFDSADELIRSLKERTKVKTLMVFMHGFRQSHASALVHAAQMFKDFDIVGAPLLLSWPSGYLIGDQSYFDAIENAESRSLSARFAQVINSAALHTEAGRIVLIGHSLGSRVMLGALPHLNLQAHSFQLILGSPDIGVEAFSHAIKPAIDEKIHLTVYASERDKALRLAGGTDSDRAGRFPHKIAAKGIDVVATDLCYSEFFDLNRHSDFSYGAASDLRLALKGLSPADRRLRARRAPSREVYWSFG